MIIIIVITYHYTVIFTKMVIMLGCCNPPGKHHIHILNLNISHNAKCYQLHCVLVSVCKVQSADVTVQCCVYRGEPVADRTDVNSLIWSSQTVPPFSNRGGHTG